MKGQELRTGGQWSQSEQGDAHQLPRATGSISGNSNICQAEEHEHTGENGQHFGQGLYKPLWGDSLMADEFISNTDMEMVHREADFPNCRTPSRGTEPSG